MTDGFADLSATGLPPKAFSESDPHSGRAGGIMVAGPSKGHDRNQVAQKPSTPTTMSTCTSNDDVYVDFDVPRARGRPSIG